MTSAPIDEVKAEWDVTRRQLLGVGALAFVLLTSGATFFHIVQKLSWVDAFYFCTVSLATVGYGDIVPKTDTEKIFLIFYVLVGIGIIAAFGSLLIKNSGLRREYRRAKRLNTKNTK